MGNSSWTRNLGFTKKLKKLLEVLDIFLKIKNFIKQITTISPHEKIELDQTRSETCWCFTFFGGTLLLLHFYPVFFYTRFFYLMTGKLFVTNYLLYKHKKIQ